MGELRIPYTLISDTCAHFEPVPHFLIMREVGVYQ